MTLKQAKTQTKTRRRKYVVGYASSGNTLYGVRASTEYSCMDPLSLAEAKDRLADMPCAGCVIFELVPVAVNR